MTKENTKQKTSTSKDTPSIVDGTSLANSRSDCPPDVEALGRGTWTLLHSIAASYPESPSKSQQSDLLSFVKLFSKLYPCWVCAEDFTTYMGREVPRVGSRDEFGKWLCGAHNDVNRKLGKPQFDCSRWQERWRTGWNDGRCD
ncbi:augmenter of liver regeneration [Pochonia chlamydosporia 170]|uniref:Sulfhydryl oxidase n=1 Tax=Pochonia chlamydosporia 170 TaxID=1380566 RepID=A0A179FM31_METCM|nr:augmenter of liver regeneration [Pochonia chlamydosporia 170]OAQ66632.1 augmenter of liver regeneration [Pochonia chlamydosporia 170]